MLSSLSLVLNNHLLLYLVNNKNVSSERVFVLHMKLSLPHSWATADCYHICGSRLSVLREQLLVRDLSYTFVHYAQ